MSAIVVYSTLIGAFLLAPFFLFFVVAFFLHLEMLYNDGKTALELVS